MKIKLIAPHEQRDDCTLSSETFKLPRLCLPLLAALTPAGHEVKIIDESFCQDNPNDDVDLVGITVITELATRAYQIADQYRRRGIKVVMGGIHPTVLPEEALKHADSVVIGEGEEAEALGHAPGALRRESSCRPGAHRRADVFQSAAGIQHQDRIFASDDA